MTAIDEFRKNLNFYLTVAAALFVFIGLVLFCFFAVAFVLVLFPLVVFKIIFLSMVILLVAAGILRIVAVIILEGVAGWLQGVKVLSGDFFFILLRPGLWKLVIISYYFPYHLARWEEQRLEIKKFGLSEKDLVYGETPYYEVARIFRKIRPGAGDEVFVDLGCGIGKVVFLVALYFKISAVGIEINSALYKAAQEIKERLKIKKALFIGGNVLEEDFSAGSIFYIHGTSWSEEVYKKLTTKFEEIKPGALVLSVSHPVVADYLKFIAEERIDLNWGREPLYIYQRVA
jgi:hypothetical protein